MHVNMKEALDKYAIIRKCNTTMKEWLYGLYNMSLHQATSNLDETVSQ